MGWPAQNFSSTQIVDGVEVPIWASKVKPKSACSRMSTNTRFSTAPAHEGTHPIAVIDPSNPIAESHVGNDQAPFE